MTKRKYVGLLFLLAAGTLQAGVPQPAAMIYGIVRDAYGCPYDEGAEITALADAQEVARCPVGGLLPGIANYRLRVDMDSGNTPYAEYAVQANSALDIVVEVGGIARPTIPGGDISAPLPGKRLRLDFITGTDSDGDGLSDEWEQLLIEQSGGQLETLFDVLPDDDFDGDGMSNRDEFLAGTFPFLATDVMAVTDMERISTDGRLKLRFLTSPQRVYHLMGASALANEPSWLPLPFATEVNGECRYQTLTGDGAYRTIYMEAWPDEDTVFIRLGVE